MSIPTSGTYKNGIYANFRQIDAQIDFTYNGTKTTYDDSKIINLDIVEEISTLNDTIPSDQLTLKLDNRDGTFNFLNLQNMQTIIASRPQIDVRLGLNEANSKGDNWNVNFNGKVSGSTSANGNISKYGRASALLTPSGAWTSELTQSYYNQIATQDNSSFQTGSTVTSGYIPQTLFSFDIIRALTDKYGNGVWEGKTALSDKIALAQQYINTLSLNWYGYGTAPSANGGNKATIAPWTGSAWGTSANHTNATVTKLTLSIADTYIDSNGFINVIAYANATDGVTQSVIQTDYIELVITTNPFNADEWIPMGSFWVDTWKNDVDALSITFTAHDNFMMLDNINYPNTGKGMTLYNLAVDIFTTAGITKYSIDNSLKSITTPTGFTKSLSCRSALQHVGIMGMSCVYQDRDGTVTIKTFATLDASLLYSNYPANGQRTLWGYPSGTATNYNVDYIINNTDGGMRYLSLDNMYTIPEISLDRSVYQVVVNVYNTSGQSTPFVVTNSSISGTNGQSFTIDNPLIGDTVTAQNVANWFITELNYNAVYKSNWIQNPCLQSTDVVIVESGNQSGQNNVIKQTRIYKQEFNYEGYLSGSTESRGGL